MQVSYSVDKNLCQVNLHGELDEYSAPKVRDDLDKIISMLICKTTLSINLLYLKISICYNIIIKIITHFLIFLDLLL